MTWSHYWRVRARLPERFGHRCRVLARGSMNTILIEFEGWLPSRHLAQLRQATLDDH
jgi:hypothetical protein